ncbi:hypothetical protein ACRASX_11125 [Flavobacterium sp. TMP13]|uniref:hypothetical protein n=1 Tax=Flavobacterium sp. TMP13 TaxID=3425950 RepID=UPI003D78A32D
MILAFTQQINNKPTYFVEKIHKGIRENYMLSPVDPSIHYPPDYNYIAKDKLPTKLHTIREDKNDRWKVGMKIDFFINVRQPNMFRFAPVLPVVGIQKVEIKWFELFGKKLVRIFINDHSFGSVKFDDSNLIVTGEILALAQNDGFNTITEFFDYFNEDFKGKLIHWTDMSY